MELKDVINENWRVIRGYESRYLISNKGEVFSVMSNKALNININTKGRPFVILSLNGNTKTCEIHRLVAENWLTQENKDYTQVNHKDENVLNNCVDNLEWCSPKYNANYGIRNSRASLKNSIQIVQEDKIRNIQRLFKNAVEAGKYYGVEHTKISKCVNGINNSCMGCTWRRAYYGEYKLFEEKIKENPEIIFIDL